MRNLKRTLCLAMAAVMMLSMMIIGAGAVSYDDLTDKDQIVHEEAVATMNALGLIVGRDDGSFDPTANITRAEMCKVITLALHGGTDPVLGTSNSTFWDTQGHWAETYIEYCAANGIIAGRGDGSFDPNSNITGTEAAKMILVALGYKSDVFKFTGPDWAINVDTRANDTFAKLYDDLSGLNSSAAINRDNAAQMLYNGVIKAKMLLMTPAQSITTGEVTYNWTWVGTMLNLKFDAHVYEGVITANQYANLEGGLQSAGEYRFKPILIDEVDSAENVAGQHGLNFTAITVAGDTTLDMLGKTYKIIIKNTVKGGVHTVVYGEPIFSDLNNIYTVSSDKTTKYLSAVSFQNEVKAAGITGVGSATTFEDFQVSTVNGNQIMDSEGNPTGRYEQVAAIRSFTTLQAATANGKIIEVIDNNNDGYADFVMVNTPIIGQITTYNANGNSGAGAITVAVKSSLEGQSAAANYITSKKFEEILTYDTLGVNDIVSYILLPSNLYYVVKLESVTGSVTAQTNDDTIKLDGVEYKQSSLGNYFDENNNGNIRNATTLGKDATLYLDQAGFVAYISAEESGYNYLYLTDVEGVGSVSGVNAKVVFTDGTTAVISIKSITQLDNKIYEPGGSGNKYDLTDESYKYGVNPLAFGVTNASNNPEETEAYNWKPATIFKYNVNNGKYELTAVPTLPISSQVLKGQAKVGGTDKVADSRTIFLTKDGNNYNVTTGVGNIKSTAQTGTAGILAYNKNNGDKVEFVVITGGVENSSTKSIYILSDEITASKNGNETVYTVKALVDGVYNGALQLSNTGTLGENDKVVPGLYTGKGIALSNDKLEYTWVKEGGTMPQAENEKTHEMETTGFYTNPTYLTSYENGTLSTWMGDKKSAAGVDTVTTSGSTKVIIITGSEENEVYLDQSLSDIAYDKTASSGGDRTKNSMIAVVRAGNDSTKDAFWQASIIYIIRK